MGHFCHVCKVEPLISNDNQLSFYEVYKSIHLKHSTPDHAVLCEYWFYTLHFLLEIIKKWSWNNNENRLFCLFPAKNLFQNPPCPWLHRTLLRMSHLAIPAKFSLGYWKERRPQPILREHKGRMSRESGQISPSVPRISLQMPGALLLLKYGLTDQAHLAFNSWHCFSSSNVKTTMFGETMHWSANTKYWY